MLAGGQLPGQADKDDLRVQQVSAFLSHDAVASVMAACSPPPVRADKAWKDRIALLASTPTTTGSSCTPPRSRSLSYTSCDATKPEEVKAPVAASAFSPAEKEQGRRRGRPRCRPENSSAETGSSSVNSSAEERHVRGRSRHLHRVRGEELFDLRLLSWAQSQASLSRAQRALLSCGLRARATARKALRKAPRIERKLPQVFL
ncbi:unnamed protein product, partial [Symbiodinium sp. CCMP2592]